MKVMLIGLALSSPLHAELFAHVQTTRGTITVAMQFDKAPQAVANFITLAEGTRPHISQATGAVVNSTYYAGEKFFRVIDTTTFKIAQTGSGTGTNSGGPGYSFRDEFDPSLPHVPYVLSMANSGVHTNGSQIFFTGNAAATHLNNVHTVFGLITDLPSRAVIDTIMTSGNDTTTITGVTFTRTDPAAIAFDELAQNLPTCSAVPGQLSVNRGVEAAYTFLNPLAIGSIFHVHQSTDLRTWTKLRENYRGYDQVTAPATVRLDGASAPRAFYNLARVDYLAALAPVSMSDRTLVIGINGNETMTLVYDATGVTGVATYTTPTQTIVTPITISSYTNSPYSGTWIVQTVQFVPLRFTGSLNSISGNFTLGTSKTEQLNRSTWQPFSSGSLSLTR